MLLIHTSQQKRRQLCSAHQYISIHYVNDDIYGHILQLNTSTLLSDPIAERKSAMRVLTSDMIQLTKMFYTHTSLIFGQCQQQ